MAPWSIPCRLGMESAAAIDRVVRDLRKCGSGATGSVILYGDG